MSSDVFQILNTILPKTLFMNKHVLKTRHWNKRGRSPDPTPKFIVAYNIITCCVWKLRGGGEAKLKCWKSISKRVLGLGGVQ